MDTLASPFKAVKVYCVSDMTSCQYSRYIYMPAKLPRNHAGKSTFWYQTMVRVGRHSESFKRLVQEERMLGRYFLVAAF